MNLSWSILELVLQVLACIFIAAAVIAGWQDDDTAVVTHLLWAILIFLNVMHANAKANQ